ncbi:MAG: hypothetical protein ACI8W3_000041 [Myxococcota bacterium]|jgi:hypothetical protein
MTSTASPTGIVEAPLAYLSEPPAAKPAFYINMAVPENPRRGPQLGPRNMPIQDARQLSQAPSLEAEGVQLVDAKSSFRTDHSFYEPDEVRAHYYPEIEALVKQVTGADRVVAFDHNLRSKDLANAKLHEAQMPVVFAHNDYTETSGPQRVRDLLPDEAESLLQKRFAVINVWRPTRAPVEELPLAVLDAQSMGDNDLVSMDLIYTDRVGEIQSLLYDEKHRWLYYSQMMPDEAMLLKCYDSSRDGRARFTAHSAFEHPDTPADATTRESVEVRTLAFF